MTSNISVENIYKSLDIISLNENKDQVKNIGDGKSKTLSMLLQKMTYSEDKHSILIIEEPENHMYPLLQKNYADITDKMQMDQIIYTTHSPHILNFKKMKQIIKLSVTNKDGCRKTEGKSLNIDQEDYKKFGFLLNEEISEMLFYDKVLLVEGVSEKYFYNALYIQCDKFRNYINKHNMGIFNVMGIDFAPPKELLKNLGVEVYIKTDNDIFKVPKIDFKRYAGYDRSISAISEEGKSKISNLLKRKIDKNLFRFPVTEDSSEIIEKNKNEINKIFLEEGIIISSGHLGFEEDFLEFIGNETIDEEDLKYLKEKKLKNLHNYVHESNITLRINEFNKNSILVRFMLDE